MQNMMDGVRGSMISEDFTEAYVERNGLSEKKQDQQRPHRNRC